MLSAEEIREVPLLSEVEGADLDGLTRSCADILLEPGEFAVHEGDEAALFAILSGRLQVVKRIDGIERVLGERSPGEIFGEVPITLGMPFPAGLRAVETARVMRIGVRQYHAAAAVSAKLSEGVAALARERIGGLQSIAAEPPKARAVLLGHRWDPDCAELRRFLERNQVSFEWVTPDSPQRDAVWAGPLPSAEGPSIRLDDGSVICRPVPRDLADRLGLQTRPHNAAYDTVIIGGGPAGLAAAVYGASEGLRTVVIEREAPGGQAGTSSRIENYLGFPSGISGEELAGRALQQAKRLGAEVVVTRTVTRIDGANREIELDGDEVIGAATVILATGVSWRRIDIEGFDRLVGKGISYGAARGEASSTHGIDIHLIGAGNSAGQAALFFARYARSVTLLVRGDRLEKSMSYYLIEQIRGKPNISVRLRCEIQSVHGQEHLECIDIRDNADDKVERCECGGLFVFIGADAQTQWLPEAIARDARGYILTGDDVVKRAQWSANGRDPYLLETSVPGIFACGDVRLAPVKRVASAVGEGSMAIALVHQFLRRAGGSDAAGAQRS